MRWVAVATWAMFGAGGCITTYALQLETEQVEVRTNARRDQVEKLIGAPKREWHADADKDAVRVLYVLAKKGYVLRYTYDRLDWARPEIAHHDGKPPASCRQLGEISAQARTNSLPLAEAQADAQLEDETFSLGGDTLSIEGRNLTDPYASTQVTVRLEATAYRCGPPEPVRASAR